MNAYEWAAVVLGIWFFVGLGVGIFIGPYLRRVGDSCGYVEHVDQALNQISKEH